MSLARKINDVQYKLDLEYQMEPLVKGKKIDKLTYVVLMMAIYQ